MEMADLGDPIAQAALDEARAKLIDPETYRDREGNQCPACGSEQVRGGFVEVDGGWAHQRVDCLDCECSWLDDYALVGYWDLQRDGVDYFPEVWIVPAPGLVRHG